MTTADAEQFVSIPGPFTGAEIYILGELLKRADLATWIEGPSTTTPSTAGSATTSCTAARAATRCRGAEAMQEFYNRDLRFGALTRLATELPLIDTDPLHYDADTTMFAQYDADDPRSIIPGFLLNFDAYVLDEATGLPIDINGVRVKSEDGRDRLYGDLWHDWLVGGTDCDWLFGGFGDDLLQLDDNLETAGGANTEPRERRPALPRRRLRLRRRRARRADRQHRAGPHVRLDRRVQQLHRPVQPVRRPDRQPRLQPARPRLHPRARPRPAAPTRAPASPAASRSTKRRWSSRATAQLWNDQHGGPRDPQPGNIGGERRDDVGGPNLHCPCDVLPIIRVVKFVEGQDANATGPVLPVGGAGALDLPGHQPRHGRHPAHPHPRRRRHARRSRR